MILPPLPNERLTLGKPAPIVRRPGVGMAVLFGAMLIMASIISILPVALPEHIVQTTAFMRITAVLQNIFVFIVPALIAAFVVTRLPATFLKIDFKPTLRTLLFTCAILVISMPFLNFTVVLNNALPLPEWLSSVTDSVEEMADDSIQLLMGGTSIGDLVMSILVIGVLTGIGEELFFRGAMQGLFSSMRINRHVAVWLTAFIFSVMHFEIYGILPRMLLGAYFGYLIWWTGSIWNAICAHALNNSIVSVATWLSNRSAEAETEIEEFEATLQSYTAIDYFFVVVSLALSLCGMYLLYRYCFRNRAQQS